jgi:nucleoside-diphosphate-sugar epimerase
MKNVLVVGGAGYIGGYVVDLLSSNNSLYVTCYDNLLYEFQYLKKIPFIFGDVRNYSKLSEILRHFDVVIWLAAIVGDVACNVNKTLTREINIDSVKWLVENYHGKIIYASTCSVYGKNDGLLDENSPVNPLSYYAETKLIAENYVLKHSDSLVFRLGTLFGQGDNYSRVRFDLVTNVFSMRAARGEPLMVIGGEQWRPVIHVKDVGEAIIHGLDSNLSGLYVLHNSNHTLMEIATLVKQHSGARIIASDIHPEDLRNYRVNSIKFRNTGWSPSYSLQYGIIEIMNLVQSQRIKYVDDNIYSNAKYMKEQYG